MYVVHTTYHSYVSTNGMNQLANKAHRNIQACNDQSTRHNNVAVDDLPTEKRVHRVSVQTTEPIAEEQKLRKKRTTKQSTKRARPRERSLGDQTSK